MIYPKENWLTDDEHGVQMPWYTRPCLEVIDGWNFKDKLIFEYGVGLSSLWYRSRGAICYGVESDYEWAKISKSDVLFADDFESYTEYIIDVGLAFDVIVIDGLYRDECTKNALKKIKLGGKLILDNWLQPDVQEFWPKTEKLIKGMDIRIFKEPNHPNWQTAIVTIP